MHQQRAFVSSAKQVEGGGGGEGAVYTHTSADTPDGGEHEPILSSDVNHPGITRKGLLQLQWLDTELECTANESEERRSLQRAPLQ